MIELDEITAKRVAAMLDILKDFCEETQCRLCPFRYDKEECRFKAASQNIPAQVTKIIDILREE